MLNKEKIKTMVNLASFEKNEGREQLKILEYYKFDYLIRQAVFSFVRFTMCFLLCSAVYIAFNTSSLFYNINLQGISGLAGKMILWYVAGLFLYLLITWIVYGIRYDRAEDTVQEYARKMKKLDRRFNGRGKKIKN